MRMDRLDLDGLPRGLFVRLDAANVVIVSRDAPMKNLRTNSVLVPAMPIRSSPLYAAHLPRFLLVFNSCGNSRQNAS